MNVLISILCGLSSSFYIKGITGQSFFQPTLLSTFALLFCVSSVDYKKIKINSIFICLFLIIFFLFSLLVVQTTFTVHTFGFFNEVGRIVYPFLVCLIVFIVSKTNKFKIEVYLLTLVFLLSVDTFYRLYFVNNVFFPTLSRYEVKGGGLIYADSNFTAFIAGALFFLVDKYKEKLKKYLLIKFFSISIVFLSASFAAYAAFIFAFFYKLFSSRNLITKIGICFLGVCTFIFVIGFQYAYFETYLNAYQDGSLKTKIEILKYFTSFLSYSDKINLFFGVGFGNFRYYNHYAHASHSILGLFVEGGIIFLLLSVLFYSILAFQKENRAAIFFIIISGLSMYPIAYLAPLYSLLLINISSLKSKSKLFTI
jgi:hypothetical protein